MNSLKELRRAWVLIGGSDTIKVDLNGEVSERDVFIAEEKYVLEGYMVRSVKYGEVVNSLRETFDGAIIEFRKMEGLADYEVKLREEQGEE